MIRRHNGKLIFGVLMVVFLCLAICPAVTATTVTTELYTDNMEQYGEQGLTLATSFNAASIELNLDRETVQQELGHDLYASQPAIHEEIIQAYLECYPVLNQPQAAGNTYEYTYGNRLAVTYLPDGSMTTSVHSVEYVTGTARASTVIETEEFTDRGIAFIPHTIIVLKGWFEFDGGARPTAYLTSFETTLLPSDRLIRTKTTTYPDLPDNGKQIHGYIETEYKTGGGLYSYVLTLSCSKTGYIQKNSWKN